jgi:solute carrier family 35 protein
MILGALIAGFRDLNFDLLSYGIVILYNICTALYLVLINVISTEEKKKKNGLSNFDYMFYNNIIAIPLLCIILFSTNEIDDLRTNEHRETPGFIVKKKITK